MGVIMRELIRSLLPVIIIISIFSASLIIPANCLARYEICKEETFGEPGNDPNININPLEDNYGNENIVTFDTCCEEQKEISALLLFSKTFINQAINLFF
jgi:hypothetical protein